MKAASDPEANVCFSASVFAVKVWDSFFKAVPTLELLQIDVPVAGATREQIDQQHRSELPNGIGHLPKHVIVDT